MGVIEWLRRKLAGSAEETSGDTLSPPDDAAAVAGSIALAAALYRELAEASNALCFSPSSIEAALSMAAAGARGETAEELVTALRLARTPDSPRPAFAALLDATSGAIGVDLVVANALWAQEGHALRPEYRALVREVYRATLEEVDFRGAAESARARINAWVDATTRGHIGDLVPPGALHAETRLVLVNAIYFKGAWWSPFDPSATRDERFHRLSGTVEAPFMRQTDSFRLVEDKEIQALELPYRNGSLTMVVILPRRRGGLPALERALGGARLARWIAALDETMPRDVEVHLPRFRVEARFHLSEVLARLGARRAFDPERADFSGMTGEPRGFCLDEVLHRAFVEVKEEGTVAAAATGVLMPMAAALEPPPPPPIFRADHPFSFFIRDRGTKQVLFAGRVLDPTA